MVSGIKSNVGNVSSSNSVSISISASCAIVMDIVSGTILKLVTRFIVSSPPDEPSEAVQLPLLSLTSVMLGWVLWQISSKLSSADWGART